MPEYDKGQGGLCYMRQRALGHRKENSLALLERFVMKMCLKTVWQLIFLDVIRLKNRVFLFSFFKITVEVVFSKKKGQNVLALLNWCFIWSFQWWYQHQICVLFFGEAQSQRQEIVFFGGGGKKCIWCVRNLQILWWNCQIWSNFDTF